MTHWLIRWLDSFPPPPEYLPIGATQKRIMEEVMAESQTPETVSVSFTKEELDYLNKYLNPEDYDFDVEDEIEESISAKISAALEQFPH